jgi:hypothetical protein
MTMGLNCLNNRPWWGAKREKLSVQRFMLAIATKRSVAKSFDQSWAHFLAWFWGFKGYEHGPRTNTRWTTSPHWLFENLDCSRGLLRLRPPRGWQKRNLMLQGRQNWRHDAKPIGFSKRALWGKGRLIKEFPNLLYEGWLQVGTSRNNLAHTFTYFANFEVLTTHCFESVILFKLMQRICLCGMVLMMHVGMIRLPTCVSDCKGNQSRERICVTSCYLTTKISCALLVAVVWLQHTRYPRFRRGTFG